ncbi:MAG: primosomal replication protein N [Burkholderiales bacterium]
MSVPANRAVNRLEISGVIVELQALRHTPAGVPVVEFRLKHASERAEAGAKRQVHAEIDAVAFEAQARLLAASALGRPLKAEGFLCAKNRRSRKPVLHVTHIEFI